MSDVDRFLGRFDEFQRWEDKQHDMINFRLEAIEKKVDSLRMWKSSVAGMAGLLGTIGGYLASLFGG